MTSIWLFAYVALPIIVVAMGYAAMRLNERNAKHHAHPGE